MFVIQATKLANVLFSYELQRRYGAHGIQVRGASPSWEQAHTYLRVTYCVTPSLHVSRVSRHQGDSCLSRGAGMCCGPGICGHSYLPGFQALLGAAAEVAHTEPVRAAMGWRGCCGACSQCALVGTACSPERSVRESRGTLFCVSYMEEFCTCCPFAANPPLICHDRGKSTMPGCRGASSLYRHEQEINERAACQGLAALSAMGNATLLTI